MHKRILILTDNVKQYECTRSLTDRIEVELPEVAFTYRHSHRNSPLAMHSDFLSLDGSLNVKAEAPRLSQEYDLIVSLHCKQLFPEELVKSVLCVNVHPGFNPINRGWYPQVFALAHGRECGATIHVMDSELDHGRIIDRVRVEQFAWDTSLTLYERILAAEMELIEANLPRVIHGDFETYDANNEEGHLYLKKDFRKLCELDLNEVNTFHSLINRLRALSHGGHKNAFFRDPETGRRVYVTLTLESVDEYVPAPDSHRPEVPRAGTATV